jgi:hypothetical protein
MNTKKLLVLLGTLVVAAVILSACATAGEPGPQGPAGPAGPAGPQGEAGAPAMAADLTCTECHNDTALITGKKADWETSIHGSGAGFAYAGERGSCAGCHSGAAFSVMIAEGKDFTQIESVSADQTHQDCRTCHQIHTTYTGEDWALETTTSVTMVTSGVTFDGGAGNLCANCHQARHYLAGFADETDPTKYALEQRFNTHYSVQADVLAGAGDFGVEGKPGAHYSMVENTCVSCHMGEGQVHTFEPQLTTCQACHADVEDFNVNDYLTEFEEDYAKLEAALIAQGLIDEEHNTIWKNADGTPIVVEAGPAQALFFYNLVHEDGSEGIHNPNYFKALMKMSLEALGVE